VTAATADERSLLPAPTWPPSAPSTSFLLTDRRRVVLADDPCEAGFPGAGPEYAGIYLHARYFDPNLGTFLSPDPIGVGGGMNAYGYGFGDPINSSDRSGLGPNGFPDIPWWLPGLLWDLFHRDPKSPPCNPFTCPPNGHAVPRPTSPKPTEYWPGKHIDPYADEQGPASDPVVVPPPPPLAPAPAPTPSPRPKPTDMKANQELFQQFQQRVCSTSGYADLNVGRNFIPLVKPVLFGGPTGGVQLANTGKVYLYGGASAGSLGYGSAFTLSPHATGEGYTAAIQVSIPPGSFQFGFGPFKNPSDFLRLPALTQGYFWEIGTGAPAGITGQVMRSWEVFELWNCDK